MSHLGQSCCCPAIPSPELRSAHFTPVIGAGHPTAAKDGLFNTPFSAPQWPPFPAPLTEQAMNPHGTLGTAQFLTAQQGCLPHCFPNIQTRKEL